MDEGIAGADESTLRRLLTTRRFGVLATAGPAGPHASLVAFAVTGDLSRIIFPTPRDTLKFRNLEADPRAALLIDDRTGGGADLEHTAAVTIAGRAREATGSDRRAAAEVFLARHPALKSFVESPECALFVLEAAAHRIADGFGAAH